MFIYLSKKIAIPTCTKINALAWNKEEGFIAVGGDNGLLKVLRLDSGTEHDAGPKSRGLAASSNLSMNETLEGHLDQVRVIIWNEAHRRLTTSDESGVIIVWMLYKGTWYEEMINNRKKSTVTGMSWNSDGTKICIVYEDGGVIVGSVDGNRIWGKELKSLQLSKVTWSPDGKLLLFGLKNGQLHLYDNQGNYLMNISVPLEKSNQYNIVGLDWYNERVENGNNYYPSLAICFENGYIQLMRSANDQNPIEIDMKILAVHCCWNHSGSLLAVAGRMIEQDKEINIVRFYSPLGEHLRTLKVPGHTISCTAWEGGSLRIALAIESYIYFANIRPDYKWCYFNKTVVYASHNNRKAGVRVCFWNTSSNQCHTKYVPILIDIASSSENCVLAVHSEKDVTDTNVMVCDTFGNTLDGQLIGMDILRVTMNDTCVVAASAFNFIIWLYNTPKSLFSSVIHSQFRAYNIDNINPLMVSQDKDGKIEIENYKGKYEDRITCMACSKYMLIIGRESGILHQYSLPDGSLIKRHVLTSKPHKIAINCNNTRASIIDAAGIFRVIDISSIHMGDKSEDKFERKDVWAMCWAADNPQSFALMEKTRMYVFKGLYPEEPISCSGYICNFQDLEIKAILLDELMENHDKPPDGHIVQLEVKSLRDTRQLLENVGIGEAKNFIEENSHPRLWRLLAEAALKKLDLAMAEFAFIKSQNYQGILLINKVSKIPETVLHKAFVALFLKKFDEAEKILMDIDRLDLVFKFRQTIGDWFRVIQLMKTIDQQPDDLLNSVYNAIGNYFKQTQNFQTAVEYYVMAKNNAQLIECYCHLNDYNALEKLLDTLPTGDPLIGNIAKKFAVDAVFPQLVSAYEKLGQYDTAKQYCILHNRWSYAFELAGKYDLPDIPDLFSKYSADLINQNQITKAIEINLQAKYYKHAGEHTFKLAKAEASKLPKDCLKLQKLYVYGAQLYHLHYQNKQIYEQDWKDSTLNVSPWKGAQAYYFMRKTHSLYHSKEYHNAMCLAYRLQYFTKYLPPVEVYSILAIASFNDEHYGVCSKTLIKLQNIAEISPSLKSKIANIATQLFKTRLPLNSSEQKVSCYSCSSQVADWNLSCPQCEVTFKVCIVSGFSIITASNVWQCNVCYSYALEDKIQTCFVCPLCHSVIDKMKTFSLP